MPINLSLIWFYCDTATPRHRGVAGFEKGLGKGGISASLRLKKGSSLCLSATMGEERDFSPSEYATMVYGKSPGLIGDNCTRKGCKGKLEYDQAWANIEGEKFLYCSRCGRSHLDASALS
eukprot:g49939.t1